MIIIGSFVAFALVIMLAVAIPVVWVSFLLICGVLALADAWLNHWARRQ